MSVIRVVVLCVQVNLYSLLPSKHEPPQARVSKAEGTRMGAAQLFLTLGLLLGWKPRAALRIAQPPEDPLRTITNLTLGTTTPCFLWAFGLCVFLMGWYALIIPASLSEFSNQRTLKSYLFLSCPLTRLGHTVLSHLFWLTNASRDPEGTVGRAPGDSFFQSLPPFSRWKN